MLILLPIDAYSYHESLSVQQILNVLSLAADMIKTSERPIDLRSGLPPSNFSYYFSDLAQSEK